MTLISQLKKLKDPERTTIVYDLYRIFMGADDGHFQVKFLDGADGEAKAKLDNILASFAFEKNWNVPGFSKSLLTELIQYSSWHRAQNKPKDPSLIKRMLEDLFNERPATPLYGSFSGGRSMMLAEPEVAYGKAK